MIDKLKKATETGLATLWGTLSASSTVWQGIANSSTLHSGALKALSWLPSSRALALHEQGQGLSRPPLKLLSDLR